MGSLSAAPYYSPRLGFNRLAWWMEKGLVTCPLSGFHPHPLPAFSTSSSNSSVSLPASISLMLSTGLALPLPLLPPSVTGSGLKPAWAPELPGLVEGVAYLRIANRAATTTSVDTTPIARTMSKIYNRGAGMQGDREMMSE